MVVVTRRIARAVVPALLVFGGLLAATILPQLITTI